MMRAGILGSLAAALRLVHRAPLQPPNPALPQPPCPEPDAPWRGLVGPGPLEWPGGSLRLLGNTTLDVKAEFAVDDTSPLRRSEVVDVVLPGRARRSATGVLVDSWVGPVQRLAVLAEVEDSARAVEDPPMYDTRVVYSAFVERNNTWVLLARVRSLSVTPDSCEAPLEKNAQLGGEGLTSVASQPGYANRSDAAWDVNCSGVPTHEAVAWEKQLELAVEWAGEVHPNGICLPAGHWHWDAPQADWAYAELKVLRTAAMTFFVPMGFSGGYVGVQDHDSSGDPGTRYVVFSVWDQGATGEVVEMGAGVEARRFQGELRGYQLVRPLRWEPEQALRFLLRAEKGDAAEPMYSAYIRDDLHGAWDLLGTVRVRPCGFVPFTGLGVLNSFIEVFNLMDCESHREATYDLWTKAGDEPWAPVTSALLSGTGTRGLRGRVLDDHLALDVGGDLGNVTVEMFHSPPPPREPTILEEALPDSGHVGPDAARRAVLASERQRC